VESGRPALIELRINPDQITTRATIADLRAGKTPPKAAAKPKRAPSPKHPAPARAATASIKKRG
jgi:acetolactate synthase I/II/III large subunit